MAKKPDEKGMSVVLFSYVPFLVGDPLRFIDVDPDGGLGEVKELFEHIETLPSASALACIWCHRNGRPMPVFLYEHATAMVEHLEAWAESKPTEWFNLHLRTHHGKYILALIPNFQKSTERWRIACQLRTGYPPPNKVSFNMVFRSPYFVSGSANTFERIRDQVGTSIEIGFLDSSLIDRGNVEESLKRVDDEIRWIGPFPISPNKDVLTYLDSILDDAKEPTSMKVSG